MSLTSSNRNIPLPGLHQTGDTFFRVALITFALTMLVAYPALAGEKVDQAEDRIRSAMVFNFCKFVQWPDTELDTLVLGVMADSDQSLDFSSIQGKAVNQSLITVRKIETSEDLVGCQVIFIPKGHEDQLQGAFAAAQAESILTISEIDGFCSKGGMIQLVERRGKLRFFINKEAAGDSQIRLSSQLLKMAKIVDRG